jgi:ribonucleoside-diphosphate reductase alpha chain/ribonucleoside-triphosphate reductase
MEKVKGNLAIVNSQNIDTSNLMIRKRAKKGEIGKVVNFDKSKIVNAIESAMFLTPKGVDKDLSQTIADEIALELAVLNHIADVEEIQDMVERKLMSSPRQEVAVNYILHRNQKAKERNSKDKNGEQLLTDEFISKYKHLPNPMSEIGTFVFYRTYSRYLPEFKRREYWFEVVRRIVEYNCSLVPTTTRQEAEELYDNVFHLRQFMSGRTNWVGNTPVAFEYPMSNFNCAFKIVNHFRAFSELFYLSMIGSGVGLRILKEDVAKLPRVKVDLDIIHEDYEPIPKSEREDSTSVIFKNNNLVKIIVGDSKEGWMSALETYFEVLYSHKYRNIKTVVINYNNVRPKGEKLKKMGGTASGHESLKTMFVKIDKVIKGALRLVESKTVKLKPIHCLDICTVIGENVVSGGVRRTAQMIIISPDDTECIDAKSELYKQVEGKWIKNSEIAHREMSNNSIMYDERPSRERLHWQIEKMRYSGEPAWINRKALLKRMPEAEHDKDCGLNPCGEAGLRDRGLCNLQSVNVMAFVRPNGTLDVEKLKRAFALASRSSYRMTCVTLELPEWDEVQKADRLLGVSFMGWIDMVNATGMTIEEERKLLRELKQVVKNTANDYADSLGLPRPKRTTALKPEGSQSNLPQVSAGIHYSHSPYYIRRVRITESDPLVKVCKELEYPVFPDKDKSNTVFIEFPCKSPEGKTKNDVSAIEQLERYLMYQKEYVEHNTSITVHVRPHEWEEVEQFVYDNWDDIVAVSFIAHDDSFYQDMPYESCSKEEYERRVAEMKPFNPALIGKYEEGEDFDLSDTSECTSGICPIK